MSHRQTQRATHNLAAEAQVEDGEDELGNPIVTWNTVLEDIRVRVDPDHELVRDEAGERVDEVVAVWGPPSLEDSVDEAMRLTLTPIREGPSYESVEPVSVTPAYGRHAERTQTLIELEDV